MTDRTGRRERVQQYKRSRLEAGVYRIINRQTGRILVGAAANLASVHNKLAFARSTGSTGALDYRLVADARQYGMDAFELEVLDVVQPAPEATREEIAAELATLETLWRERYDPATLY